MSRWHADWCTSPIIQVGDDQIPRCEKCKTSAHARLKTADRPNPVLSVPKDEEYGSLNLSWPPTVTFTSGENAIHPPADKSKDDQGARPAPGSTSNLPVADQGIGTALSSDEFRLVVLHAAGHKGKSYPIHVDLESHKDTHFPDYDAVSYTWGDEDGDAERCQPVFVGDHWDIIFQTKNCCHMLRYLRPSRGMKLLWVDAICIDQNNTDERATQVAKMGQIYSRCSQVWAWLGNDLVPDDVEGLPERRWFHELETTPEYAVRSSQGHPIPTITELLKRRYFTRVWIIQELVLAPRILFPIGNVVFTADHNTACELERLRNDWANTPEIPWNRTEAPWFKHIIQGNLNVTGLWEIMALTSKSRASDFRDKLYGILGLLSSGSNCNLLQPNYAISARQMVIGFFAHCLLNERRAHLFLAAQGHTAQKDPSWLPAWETQQSWEQLFVEPPDMAYYDRVRFRLNIAMSFRVLKGAAMTPPKSRLDEMKIGWRSGTQKLLQVYPWYRDFTVDTNTGSISMWLTRLATISSAPVEALDESIGDLALYGIHCGSSQLFWVRSQHPLDRLLKPEDELYAFDPELSFDVLKSDYELVFMVLRKTGDGSHTHRLVTCFQYLCFLPGNPRSTRRHLAELHESVYAARWKFVVQARLDRPVYEVEDASRWAHRDNIYIFPLLFPGNRDTTVSHILPIFTGRESFERLQENEVCARRGQKVTGDYLEFEFEIDFATQRGIINEGDCQADQVWLAFCSWIEWEWRRPGEENKLLWRRLPRLRFDINHEDLGLPGGMMRIHLRCQLEAVRKVIADKAQLLGITALWESHMYGDTLEAFEKNIRSEVTEEDLLIPSPSSGRSRMSLRPREFDGLDGSIYRVCIA